MRYVCTVGGCTVGVCTSMKWWQTGTVYQIYPPSFSDTTGDGIGDLPGITQKLDYLNLLGVDAVWLTPIYPSPMVDNGYDIMDYYAVNPMFGSMEDFETLVKEAHGKEIRVILDMVLNHTSTQHMWFQDSIRGRGSQYRDYYIWKDGKDGGPPNNWLSKFGGSAWCLDKASQQYYLHLFAEEQADLNWDNPAVREDLKNVLRFWARKGVDGFRLDVINLVSKPTEWVDDQIGDGRRFYTDGPRVHEYLQELHRDVFKPLDLMTAGEMSSTNLQDCIKYSALGGHELSMVFTFHHLKADYPGGEKWTDAPIDFHELKNTINYWQTGMSDRGWMALFWGNHDQPRMVSRINADDASSRELAAMMLASTIYFMKGTPYIFQGEEIGMRSAQYSTIEEYRDVESLNTFKILTRRGVNPEEIVRILQKKSRDNSRAPMPWNPEGGFSTGDSWIGMLSDCQEVNVENNLQKSNSVFHWYQKLIKIRKQFSVLVNGDYRDLSPYHCSVFAYIRDSVYNQAAIVSISNFTNGSVRISLPEDVAMNDAECIMCNYGDISGPSTSYVKLRPYESRVLLRHPPPGVSRLHTM